MKPRILAAAAVSAALIVTSCGGGSDETGASSAESKTESATAPAKTEESKTAESMTEESSMTESMTEESMTESMTEESMTESMTDTMTEESSAGGTPTGGNVCPEHLVIQTDWFPELEHGGTYQLIGTEGEISKDKVNYSGNVQPQYAVGGLKTVEINTVKFDKLNSSILLDGEADMAYINMSDIIKDSSAVDMVAVAKTLEKDPQMIMWDPAQNDIQDPADIGKTGLPVLHFPAVAYIDYMIGEGWISEDQSDPSYDGSDFQFVAQNGNIFQQGFATNEVYKYENEIDWKDGAPAPVKYYTVGDIGFPNYAASITMMRSRADELSECLKLLVPKMQQAWVDYYNDPQPILTKLIEINTEHDGFWTLSDEVNEAGYKLLQDGGFADNSPDGTYCSFDEARVQKLYDILAPIYAEQGTEIAPSIDGLFTNEYCAGAPGRE